MSKYDTQTTTFSPEGRLYQVEYAMEAINNAATCVALLTKDGIVIGVEKKIPSKLLATSEESEKIYVIDDHVICAVAGLTADANILLQEAREDAQDYLYKYHQPKPVEELVSKICTYKHSYTQVGGLRPFGVSFLFAGWDKNYGYQIYHSDPSGNFYGWKAHVIGANNTMAKDMLKKEYKDDLDLDTGLQLAARVLYKCMDANELNADKMEFATLRLVNNKVVYHLLTAAECNEFFKRVPAALLAKE